MTVQAAQRTPRPSPQGQDGVLARARTGASVARLGLETGWARIRPALAIVSPIGWLVVVAAIAFLIAGYRLGWTEFVFLGATLAAGAVIAFAFVFGRASYDVGVELTPRRVTAGKRALGRLTVRNIGAKQSSPSRMELPVGQATAEFTLPAIASGEEHEELFAVPTNRRAVIIAGPAVSVRGDQLGLVRRTITWSEPTELFVHPVTVRLQPSAAGLVRDLEGEVTKKITSSDISFHALRPYESGDDIRHVHWRTSARTGQLMVRQFEETRRSQLTIVHATDARWYADEDEFELGVSVMASLGVQVVSESTGLQVVTEAFALRTHTPTALLDDACRIERGTSRYPTLREFARLSTATLPPPSVVMIVAGSSAELTDFRSVQRLFGIDAQTFAFRIERGATPSMSRGLGFTLLTVGDLADLPALVKKAR